LGDVVDQLLDEHGFADARATVKADLAPTGQGCDEVDDLDPGLEDLWFRLLVLKGRRRTVDRPAVAGHVAQSVKRRAEDVEQAAERGGSDRNGDWLARVDGRRPTAKAVGASHGERADPVVA